uniref:DUF3558 domain-containing protein n=1 Tax=Nocardia paucivorans TaxID=114259 RepID=UPI0014613482
LTAAAVMLASGCGVLESGEASNQGPVTTTRDIDTIVVFDPCTQINDDVLASVGLDPASKSVVTNAAEGPTSWRVCSWTPADIRYSVGVYSTSHTLEETRKNDDVIGIREITVGGRPGLTFHAKWEAENNCYVAFEAQQGMFEVDASWLDGNPSEGDICAIAMQHALAFEPHLPD